MDKPDKFFMFPMKIFRLKLLYQIKKMQKFWISRIRSTITLSALKPDYNMKNGPLLLKGVPVHFHLSYLFLPSAEHR